MNSKELKDIENLWQLQHMQPYATTFSSHIYLAQYQGTPVTLKFIKPESDEHHSPEILRYFGGKGAAKLLQSQENALLLEYLDSELSLKELVEQGKDDEATHIIASVIKELHSERITPLPQNVRTLQRHLRSLFRKAETEPFSIYDRAAKLAQELLFSERDVCLLHGDIHHENILHSKRGWLAIDPKGIIGERTYEVANTLCNPDKMPNIVHNMERMQRQADVLASILELDKKRILAFAFVHSCISMCWSIEDNQDISYAMKCSELLERCLIN